MKRQTVVLPFSLPCLTDKAAAQLLELLHELFSSIEFHYAAQVFRYNQRHEDKRLTERSSPSELNDLPF